MSRAPHTLAALLLTTLLLGGCNGTESTNPPLNGVWDAGSGTDGGGWFDAGAQDAGVCEPQPALCDGLDPAVRLEPDCLCEAGAFTTAEAPKAPSQEPLALASSATGTVVVYDALCGASASAGMGVGSAAACNDAPRSDQGREIRLRHLSAAGDALHADVVLGASVTANGSLNDRASVAVRGSSTQTAGVAWVSEVVGTEDQSVSFATVLLTDGTASSAIEVMRTNKQLHVSRLLATPEGYAVFVRARTAAGSDTLTLQRLDANGSTLGSIVLAVPGAALPVWNGEYVLFYVEAGEVRAAHFDAAGAPVGAAVTVLAGQSNTTVVADALAIGTGYGVALRDDGVVTVLRINADHSVAWVDSTLAPNVGSRLSLAATAQTVGVAYVSRDCEAHAIYASWTLDGQARGAPTAVGPSWDQDTALLAADGSNYRMLLQDQELQIADPCQMNE